MKRLIALVFLLSVSATAAAAQDFKRGTEAYWKSEHGLAFEQLLPLAQEGNADAQFYIGRIYGVSKSEPYDETLALQWTESSANLGLGDAQFVIGRWYKLGAGLPKDNVLAYMWLNLSSGSRKWLSGIPTGKFKFDAEDAVTIRDFIAEEMSSGEIKEAQRRTREWLDAHPR